MGRESCARLAVIRVVFCVVSRVVVAYGHFAARVVAYDLHYLLLRHFACYLCLLLCPPFGSYLFCLLLMARLLFLT